MYERFLDPRNDVVFKKIFGEHPRILRSFLNALLPLDATQQIVSLEYLPAEQVPVAPLMKNSIVDVKCTDKLGRIFIVEMQMNWTNAFMQRVLFNASKAFVKQLAKGEQYHLLQPVMGLSVVDDSMGRDTPDFYHHYKMVNIASTDQVIEGLQLIFIELPKFQPTNTGMEKARQAWLRFLKETGSLKDADEAAQAAFKQEVVSGDAEISEALELTREAAFTPAEMEAYDKYWDMVSSERTLMGEKFSEGKAEGKAETLLKILTKRLGPLSGSIHAAVRLLTVKQLEELEDQVLDFPTVESLRKFLT
jgi:predicted transposase/invertase (TIGR01784 family)